MKLDAVQHSIAAHYDPEKHNLQSLQYMAFVTDSAETVLGVSSFSSDSSGWQDISKAHTAAPEQSFDNQFMIITEALKHARAHTPCWCKASPDMTQHHETYLRHSEIEINAYKHSTIVALHRLWLFWPGGLVALSHCSCLAVLTLQ